MAYNVAAKLSDNIIALEIALKWIPGQKLSDAEIIALQKYAGFGGIKPVLFPRGSQEDWIKENATENDMRLYHPVMHFHQMLQDYLGDATYKQARDSLRASALTAFYTPSIIPSVLYSILEKQRVSPNRLYEPSAGAGIFISEAVKSVSGLEQITAVEKDFLTSKVLQALSSSWPANSKVHYSGFEETPASENNQFDLVVSNIPFGNFQVYDQSFLDKSLTSKIHNYFFIKALTKVGEGGLIAFITTNGFLDSPSNQSIRQYLFQRADLVSVCVLPDNLMKDTGNTEAASHLLIVQKNSFKSDLSSNERLIVETAVRQSDIGEYSVNSLINVQGDKLYIGNRIFEDKDQYGRAHLKSWQDGNIDEFEDRLSAILSGDFTANFNKEAFLQLQQGLLPAAHRVRKTFTLKEMPDHKQMAVSAQIGLFETSVSENGNRAVDYLTKTDETIIKKDTARLIGAVKTTEHPEHEIVVLITAKAQYGSQYVYKLYANAHELLVLQKWLNAGQLTNSLQDLSSSLRQYDYNYLYEGDKTLEGSFNLTNTEPNTITRLQDFYKNGILVINDDKVGVLTEVDKENNQATFTAMPVSDKDRKFYERYVTLRDSYCKLVGIDESNADARATAQTELAQHYNNVVGPYGELNELSNKKLILNDDAYGNILLFSLERLDNGRHVKSDFLTDALKQPEQKFSTDIPTEALARSLNDLGKVDLNFISEAINKTPDESILALHDHIYLNPGTRNWETRDQYLSGNVVEKLVTAQNMAANSSDAEIARSLKGIQKVQPEPIPFELLDFNLGERWLPVSYYTDFAAYLFDQAATVNYVRSADSFRVVASSKNAKITEEYAIKPKSGQTMYGTALLEHALENTAPFFSYEITGADGSKIRIQDTEAIQLANQKIESMRQHFTEWMRTLPEDEKSGIQRLYNDTYNCYVLRDYDGSHQQFPDLNRDGLGISDLYSSQKNAIWRIVQNRGALVDHEVGLGKTLTMVVAAREMKRLGIIRKPAILALKANVRQIVETYRKAYPGSKIIAPSENDFTPVKRQQLFLQIKNNNWDVIILTHDQFGAIQQSLEVQKKIFQDELYSLEKDLDTMKEQGGDVSKRMRKGLELRKQNLSVKLKEVQERLENRRDEDISFKDLGIDHLFIDESHKFKNLTFTTRHDRVAGLGNMAGSQKALNMLFAVRTLQERFNSDLCVTFLSGTPISNSLTEMYLLFKYLRPKEMERQSIENFDGWAAVFARKTTDFEFSVTNQIIAKERFRHFIKVPELALFYNEITDYKTAQHIRLDKPELDEELINIKPTPDQQEFIKNLLKFAENGDATLLGRSPLTAEEDKGRMLIATNYAKKMALDMRLINVGEYADHPDSKVNTCARKVAEWYENSNEHKGTQIIFCDLGTPKADGFNVYDALKEKLVTDFKIPAHEVTYIHDWTDKTKPDLFKKMNRGTIRVLIGSTDKAGTGLNVQRKVIAMHHLDIPWKPSELEQRNGRGARQGNWIAKEHFGNKVKNFIYAVEQTLDNYKFNLLKNKQMFISQMKNCSLHTRTIDEGAMDEQSGMNFSEYIAILSGDTSLLEKSRVEKKIAVLESLRGVHYREISQSKGKLESLKNKEAENRNIVEKLRLDQTTYKTALRYEKDKSKANIIDLPACKSKDVEKIGQFLIRLNQTSTAIVQPEGNTMIGSLYGFELYIRLTVNANAGKSGSAPMSCRFYAQSPQTLIQYNYNDGYLNIDNPKLAARYFLNAIDRVDSLIEQHQKRLDEVQRDIPLLENIIHKPFEKENELIELKRELAGIEKSIATQIKERQEKQVPDENAPKIINEKENNVNSVHKIVIDEDIALTVGGNSVAVHRQQPTRRVPASRIVSSPINGNGKTSKR